MRIAPLNDELERLLRQAADEQRAAARASEHYRDRQRPMHERLLDHLRKVPDDVKRNGLSMDFLCGLVQGQKGRGSFAHVAAALRKLGWFRVRCWSRTAAETGGFRALWYPPEAAPLLAPLGANPETGEHAAQERKLVP